MNKQIARLFGITALLFAVLIAATSYSTVFGADSLQDNSKNRRELIRDARVPRGLILARDGTVLAKNKAEGKRQNRFFTRVYPSGPLFSNVVGYSFIRNGRRSLERSRNDDLAGQEDEFQSLLSDIENQRREGFDVRTNLDPEAQKAALDMLGGRKGGVVAIAPSSGRVRVMASTPGYDPNSIPSDFARMNRDPNKPLLNRATQELYPPGSTFKVVTAAAALDSGKFTPQSIVNGSSPKNVSGSPLENFGGQDFGPIPLTDALTQSVNTVWASVGEQIGRRRLSEYMTRFGFNADPQLDYPDEQMAASGIYDGKGRLLRGDSGWDIGRVAIGQGGLEGAIVASPLQMAMVASAVANGGKLMKPRIADRVVRKDGRVKQKIQADLQSQVISRKAADQLTAMMARVVEEGTGTAAALEGVKAAGKTGTAEIGANREFTQPWFIGFAPVDNPKIAVAVTVERQPGGSSGGQTAGPIAKRMLEILLPKE